MGMKELISMQKDLMEFVPHEVSPNAFTKMMAGADIIDALLRFLNSTGHKPWRPIPLGKPTQDRILGELDVRVGFLKHVHASGVDTPINTPEVKHYSRQLISAFGVIEETIEHLQTLGMSGSKPADQLEELVDGLFFWLEQFILSGFTWEQVEQQYGRKWSENMDRYQRAKMNDYSWDKRSEGKL